MSIYRPPEYHNTTAEPSSFAVLNDRKTFQKKVTPGEDIPKGRPLWQVELRKQNPAPTTYEQDNLFGNKKQHFKTQCHSFKNSYASYRRTCDIQKNIKVFDEQADHETKGLDYEVKVTQTKKRFPAFSSSKAQQHALWDEGKSREAIRFLLEIKLTDYFFSSIVLEVKLADNIPGCDAYKPLYTTQMPTRFNDTHLGTDIKMCEKLIKFTPGPGHYNSESTRGRTHNIRALNGPYKAINQLIAVTQRSSLIDEKENGDSKLSPDYQNLNYSTKKSPRQSTDDVLGRTFYKVKGYPFKAPLLPVETPTSLSKLRGPMLAGKALD